jgi:hypothetical protein
MLTGGGPSRRSTCLVDKVAYDKVSQIFPEYGIHTYLANVGYLRLAKLIDELDLKEPADRMEHGITRSLKTLHKYLIG